jgi:hypothetical protein
MSLKKKQQVVASYRINPDDQDVIIDHLIWHYITEDLNLQASKLCISLRCNAAENPRTS